MSNQAWLVDDRTQWHLGVEHPTEWCEWLQTFDVEIPITQTIDALPMAGIAGDGWHLAALAKRGEPLGLLDLAIELNRIAALRSLVNSLNWQSPVVRAQAGMLAQRCFLLASNTFDRKESLFSAAIMLLARGAKIDDWIAVAKHTLPSVSSLKSFQLPNERKTSKKQIFELEAHQIFCMPVPMCLILSPASGVEGELAFAQWLLANPESMALCRIEGTQESQANGAGISHACVWANKVQLLALGLRTSGKAWSEQTDFMGRTPLKLAVALEAFWMEKEFHSYNARSTAQAVLNGF